jgi:Aerotolerance regulator N-terminal/von Willebrand factor type A domain
MNWLALSPVEIGVAWTALAGLALWLYLHHRRPQHRKVSTLRFWASVQPVSQPRRRRLREPWAFVAQAAFLLLVILALANPRWGPAFERRSVVIVLDTSIWSQTHPRGEPAWIDRERAEALRVLDSLPSGDHVLLLRAEADAPPILPFTTDREAVRRAILAAQASSVAPDLPRAVEVARAALGNGRRGLLVYIGPGLSDAEQARRLDDFRSEVESPDGKAVEPQFVVRLVGDSTSVQNRGITRLSLRRDASQPDRWHLLTQLKNYGRDKADVVLTFSVDGQPLGQRNVSLAPGELASAENEFTWDKGGLLQAEIGPPDALDADNRAAVTLPTFRTVRVAMFTGNSSNPSASALDLLSVLLSNPYVQPEVVPPGMSADIPADVAVYQGTSMPAKPAFNSIWFAGSAPAAGARSLRVTGWNAQHPVTRWVRTHDISVRNPAALKVQPGDTVLAYTEGNPPAPLILAREQGGHRILLIGFDPHDSNLPLESAFPLLMAGSLEWMTHSVDEVANSLSTGEVDLPGPATKVVAPSGKEVPFARKDSEIHLLALETGMYRIIAPGGETSVAVNPPALPSERLEPTATETAGIEREPLPAANWNLWRWLILLAIAALWAEWWLYYSARERQRAAEVQAAPEEPPLPDADRELEEQERSEFRNPNYAGR